jgi:hypothetical protein
MRRIGLGFAGFLAAALIAAGSGSTATSKSSFVVFVEPTITAARNGLTIETELEGSFNVAGKSASGSGSYAVIAGGTVVESGALTLTRLVAFQFYGCGELEGTPLEPDWCGGRAIFRVQATSSTGEQGQGLLEVNCQIHEPGGRTPAGTSEGVKVNARGINFNKHVTGDNLFVMQ